MLPYIKLSESTDNNNLCFVSNDKSKYKFYESDYSYLSQGTIKIPHDLIYKTIDTDCVYFIFDSEWVVYVKESDKVVPYKLEDFINKVSSKYPNYVRDKLGGRKVVSAYGSNPRFYIIRDLFTCVEEYISR